MVRLTCILGMKPKAEHLERIQAAATIAIAATSCEADDSAADPAAAGSPFDAIYDTYAPLMRRIAVAKFGISANDAADLVHDVFATYLVNPSRVTELRPYLIGAICNASRSYLRRKAAKDAVCSGLDDCLAASDQGLLDAVVRDVLVGRILGRLGRSCRDVLHRFSGREGSLPGALKRSVGYASLRSRYGTQPGNVWLSSTWPGPTRHPAIHFRLRSCFSQPELALRKWTSSATLPAATGASRSWRAILAIIAKRSLNYWP